MANIELDGANKKIKVDSGDLTLDVPGDIILDADGADLVFADGGTNILKVTNSSSDVVFQPQVDAKDLKFNQYDGRTLLEVNDGGYVAIANGATGPGQLRLYEDTDNGTNFTAFQVGTQSGDITYTLPTADGSNGQVLTTNGSGVLSFATASSADPSSADGDSLGTASAEWSDLYLADGGIVYFGNDQDIRLTHNADKGLILKHSATADDKPVILTLQTGETDLAANDVIGKIEFQAPDEGTGTDAILVSAAVQAVAEGDHSSSSNATRLEFMTGASEAAAAKMVIDSAGDVAIGSTAPSAKLEITDADDTYASGILLSNDGGVSEASAIYHSNSGATSLILSNRYDNAAGSIKFNLRENGTSTTALEIVADGRGLSQFTAKVWANYDGNSNSVRDSHNVSSVTDNGTGDYTYTFSNNLANTNYAVVSGVHNGTSHGDFQDVDAMLNNVGSVQVKIGYVSATNSAMTAHDVLVAQIAIFGD